MSKENVDLARQVAKAVANQDLSTLIELTDPEVEWRGFFAQLQEGGVYRGHDGIRQYVNDIAETFEVIQLDIEDTLAVGDVVLLIGRLRYRGKGSGIDTDSRSGYFLKVRQGKIVFLRAFREPEAALERFGHSE